MLSPNPSVSPPAEVRIIENQGSAIDRLLSGGKFYQIDLSAVTLSPDSSRVGKTASTDFPSYDELASAGSVAELRKLYAEKYGATFVKLDDFIHRVRRDWSVCANGVGFELKPDPRLENFEPLVVEQDGVTYRIFGVAHVETMRERINSMLARQIGDERLIIEENLGPYCQGRFVSELSDHDFLYRSLAEKPVHALFVNGLLNGISLGLYKPDPIFELLPSSSLDLVAGDDLLSLLSGFWDGPNGKNPQNAFPEVMMSCPEPFTAEGGLPPNIILELKQELGLPLSTFQRRSAFMAEVLRHWQDGATVRNLLSGRAHAAEIEYFLKHPTSDPVVVERAKEVAAAFAEGSLAVESGKVAAAPSPFDAGRVSGFILFGGWLLILGGATYQNVRRRLNKNE